LNRINHEKAVFLLLLFIGAILLVFNGCMKKQSYPDIPAISLLSFEMFVDTAHIVRTVL